MNQPVLVSGIKPTNKLTLGNYLGAIINYVKLQNDYDCHYFVADYHAMTTPFDAKEMAVNRKSIIKYYLACGVDTEKTKIFYQSAVHDHFVCAGLLMMFSTIGELSRMTQFKDKSAGIKLDNNTYVVPTGLLTYPVLMAADILIYDASVVPVGEDQIQHLELTRNLAERLNNKYGTLFKIPSAITPKYGSRIMDLQDPSKKMSKSNISDKGTIFLDDDPDIAYNKILKAKTDSLNTINYDKKNQPGISNLIEIYCAINEISPENFLKQNHDLTYGTLKIKVGNSVKDLLIKIQNNYAKIDDTKLENILAKSHKYCNTVAKNKVEKLQKTFGLYYE